VRRSTSSPINGVDTWGDGSSTDFDLSYVATLPEAQAGAGSQQVWCGSQHGCRSTHARRPARSCVLSGLCAQLAHMATGLVGAQWRVHRPAEDLPLELLLTVEVQRAVGPARNTSLVEPDAFADDVGDDADGRGAAQRYGAVFTGERSLQS
jgi:hypothetical protein